ncbi:MAG TPA: cellulase family glycosylhydrolase [Solirubrobacteraceae bacterium]
MRLSSRPRAALAVLACALAAAATAVAAPPAPRVSGSTLIDAATGAPFVPHGVNWPSFEYACLYGYGYSNERSRTSVGPDDADAASIARWDATTVRIPLNQDCWLGDDGLPRSDRSTHRTPQGYRRAVRAWVERLHRHGLAVILDLHWSGPDGVRADGQRAMADDRSVAFWASVAGRFRGDPAVMFDVFNEPYSRWDGDVLAFDLTWGCWSRGGCRAPAANDARALTLRTYAVAGMQAIVDAIRGAGARQPILLAGRNYANDLGGWLVSRPLDDQLVASVHSYPGQGCDTAACWDAEVAPVAAQVPVVATEIGQDGCRGGHVARFMDWADRHRVGYLAWEWVLPDTRFSCRGGTAYSLIADTRGTPRQPVGTTLRRHLGRLAVGASTEGVAAP